MRPFSYGPTPREALHQGSASSCGPVVSAAPMVKRLFGVYGMEHIYASPTSDRILKNRAKDKGAQKMDSSQVGQGLQDVHLVRVAHVE